MITQRLERWASDAAEFVAVRLRSGKGLGSRSFYGEAFGLLLLEKTGRLGPDLRDLLLRSLEGLDRGNWEFHWEFHNYALLRYHGLSGDGAVKPYLDPLRFRDWPVTNWVLLKALDLALAGRGGEAGHLAKPLLRRMQLDSGFILDEADSRSVQYHAFAALLLWELAEATGDVFYLGRFSRACAMLRHFILSNGDSIYLGRGQRQIFGYACLLYVLAAQYTLDRDPTILGDLERVLGYLEGYRRSEGVPPLVLNPGQPDIPEGNVARDPRYAGWYSYNNYFDYLCFFGYFAARAADLLGSAGPLPAAMFRPPSPYRDGFFLKTVKPGYEAVLALCGGSLTNDMPVPYLVAGGRTLTPCYGGEKSRVPWRGRSALPLPRVPAWGLSARDFPCRWEGDAMVFDSPISKVRRIFAFGEDSVTMETTISGLRLPLRHQALFLEPVERGSGNTLRGPGLSILSGSALRPAGYRFSASGRLALFTAWGRSHRLELRPLA